MEFDAQTNRCVGFALPFNQMDLAEADSFLGLTFEGIEKLFGSNKIAKYAYVYMAQSLSDSCPSFCLAIMGTNNKFTAKCVKISDQHEA